jgi:mono/diheme cytochrome c family protein
MNRWLVIVALAVLASAPRVGHGESRPVTDVDALAGKALYLRECAACHGDRGDGKGPAAEYVDPRPRDFTAKHFKLRTTASGQPPATRDLLATVERGIPGTAMPPFAFLSQDERRKVVAYVLTLADLIDDPEPTPIGNPGPPPAATPESVAKGKQLFVDAGCVSCHGLLGKGDGNQEMKDAEGRPIRARDFTTGVFRGGSERADIVYRIATGMDGSPMPSYGNVLEGADLWAVTDYVRSLVAPPAAEPLPADPIAAGRIVAARYSCVGCHVLDDGKGGDVGPDLRLSGRKLDSDWVRTFLSAPREYGKIYPWRVARMPGLKLTKDEVGVMTRYLAAIGKRPDVAATLPDPATFPAASVSEGKLTFVLRCAQCHALGKVVETPAAAQQGPDLIRVAGRVDYAWARDWILDPTKVDPKTRMTKADMTPAQVDAVRMFLWKTSIEAGTGARHARAEGIPAP